MAAQEANSPANSIKNDDLNWEEKDEEKGENEEIYEDIEAPKFVDFTVPDHYRPDDRYWFCLRVGCDQKHEEEMDSEAIHKNFVLRVMAARSPNVKLHKALNRNCSSKNIKCPLSAPPKSSKSRLSRLAIVPSFSQKLSDDKEKAKRLPKVTPKAKGKQVAAKYLTTPRNKNCIQNQNAFRSVQNPKPPSAAVPKSRMVAKALTFTSPKKAISLKKSVELRTPLMKLCEGMKRLEITSQRKPVLGCSGMQSKQLGHNSQKVMPVHSSTRERDSKKERCRTKVSQQLHSQLDRDAKYLRSLKGKNNKGKTSKHSSIQEISCGREVKAKSRDNSKEHPVEKTACPISNVVPVIELASSDALEGELNNKSDSQPTNSGENDLSMLQASRKEDDGIQENVHENSGTKEESLENGENSNNISSEEEDNSLGEGGGSEIALSDDKENASASDGNRNYNDNKDQSGRKFLGIQNSDSKKVTKAADKDLKGHGIVGDPGMKLMKLKPTHPKPFRLRTDERGILREANLERKNKAITPKREAAVVSRFQGGDLQGQHVDIQKGIASLKPAKQQVRTKTPAGLSKAQHSKHQPERDLSVTAGTITPDKPLGVTVETSAENSELKEVGKACKKGTITTVIRPRAPACSRPLSRGRRLVTTIPKEPNFHRSHMPKSCAVKIS
ncbi:hypothetical protein ACH5RR_022320 [Cinchona calisaya]|uniref:Uncharacterized protein n=1 Tax=Cinchona calisaya TaxID=153742 RepID=A0ABD2ZCF6_9GENT